MSEVIAVVLFMIAAISLVVFLQEDNKRSKDVFKFDAIDRDNDGIVQEGTSHERPAVKKAAKKAPAKKAPAKKTTKK